nr:MFS transporter [Nocardioides sp. zg-DK7169]
MFVTTVTGIVGSLGSPLVPGIARAEGVSLVAAQWTLTVTLITGAVATPVVGRLGAGRRRRPVLLTCVALAALGTLLGALPLGFEALLAGRTLTGMAFAIVPLLMSVARTELAEHRIRPAVSAISVANVTAAGLGFPVTALVATVGGIRGAFWFAFAMCALAFVVALLLVPRSAEPAPPGVDWVGAVLLSCATFALLLGVSQADGWGYASPLTAAVVGGGLVLYAVCVIWLLRARNPLVDVRIAVRRGVAAANVAGLLAGCGMYVMLSLVMILVQTDSDHGYGLGRSVAVAGLMLTPYAAASVVGSRLALRLGNVIRPDLLLPLGCLSFALANLVLARWHQELWQVMLVLLIGGLGSGMTFNSMPWLMMRHVPAAETSSALSLNLVLRFLGMSIGSAVALAILDVLAEDGLQTSHIGFVVGGLSGFGLSLVAAVLSLLLGRPRRFR